MGHSWAYGGDDIKKDGEHPNHPGSELPTQNAFGGRHDGQGYTPLGERSDGLHSITLTNRTNGPFARFRGQLSHWGSLSTL